MRFAQPLVEKHGLIAVVPEGIQHSFNAKVCCGAAMEKKIDDLGFLRLVRDKLPAVLPVPGMMSPDLVFAVGWSNGAFLATLDITQSANKRVFAAVVPISGFQPLPEISLDPIPMFMHHSRDDRLVNFGGCCQDPAQKACCCSISEASPMKCVSTRDYFRVIGKLNKCNVEAEVVTLNRSSSRVLCSTFKGCQRNVTFCEYHIHGHFANRGFHRAFPTWMAEEVANFIAGLEDLPTRASVGVDLEPGGFKVHEPALSGNRFTMTSWITLIPLLLVIAIAVRIMRTRSSGTYVRVDQAD